MLMNMYFKGVYPLIVVDMSAAPLIVFDSRAFC